MEGGVHALAGSSVGSNIFAVAALLVIGGGVLLLLRYFLPLRTTPAYLSVPIFLALFLPASIIILVPIDLASSTGTACHGSRGIWLGDRVMLVAWRITYWLCFSLTWFILPLLGEYADAGYRSPKERVLYSLRSNGKYQLAYLTSAVVGTVYFFLQSGASLTNFKALVMALAYCWGLIIAIYLLGHGLVAVPRELFRNADNGGRLKRLQSKAPKIHDRLEDSMSEMVTLESQVTQLRSRKNGVSHDLKEWIEDLTDISSLPESIIPSTSSMPISSVATIPTVITEQYLANLTRQLKRERHKCARFNDEWMRLVGEAASVQAMIDSKGSKRLDIGKAAPHASFWERSTFLTPYTRYLLYAQIVPIARYLLSGLLCLASISIVWSELTKKLAPKLSLISLTIVHHPSSSKGQIGFSGQVIAALWLLYMCTAALSSISAAKIWGNRALVRRNTYGESACWYGSLIAKLTVPLAYNMVTFLPPTVYTKTTFYHFLGRLIQLTPLGKNFDYFFPMFILIPVAATLFNLYGKTKSFFGFSMLEDDEDDAENPSGYGTGSWREGRDLIERELSGNTAPHGHASAPAAVGRSRAEPTLWVPPAQRSSSPNTAPPTLTAQRRAQQARLASEEAEGEEENFFEGFAHRVRNTLDTVDTPVWMREGFKKPKWMRGEDGREDSGLGRWFGGRPREGGVRL